MTAPLTLIRVVDTETTGMDDGAQVVEVGWTDVRFFPEGWGIERGPSSQLCRVTVPIEPEARAAHHITDEELIGMPSFPADIEPMIVAGVDFFAAHNADFDSRFFGMVEVPWLCTMKIAAALFPDFPSFGNQALRYRLGLEFDDLEATLPAHRAGPDSYVTAHLLVRLLSTPREDGRPYPLSAFQKVSAEPKRMRRFNFGKHKGELISEVPFDYLDWIVSKSDLDEATKWNCRRELDRRRAL